MLALNSSARTHELSCLDTRYLVRHHTGYSFSFGNVTKSARNGKLRYPIRFEHFKENKELCVCHHIDLYLQRTSLWRTGNGFLLLGLVKPHKPVKPATIAKWILCVMTQAGIDTTRFKAHSTRSASSSRASSQGVPLSEILKKGHWSFNSTFEKFYNREVEETSVYESSVLKL